ncbi:SDR family oxidoreductase [Actinoallomurus sp. NBC_01490]|uniref:SDR family oxidoreductase n=1 Tax=Actinoallomurus sp. NBC_01490 TaxID=2903557 RepID=UPI002E30EB47|nr:SDR family oxidoreductase [Actinoallomurus sp. NBC_01490]
MSKGLTGRVALVTGASAGIGRGVAAGLAAAGASVLAVARRGELLDTLVSGLPTGDGREHATIVADLAVSSDVDRVISVAGGRGVDILINNAGSSVPAPVGTGEPVWEETFAIQFHTPRRITEALSPEMRRRRYGRVIMLGGTLEPTATPNASTAAKAALAVWAKAFSNAVAADGVTVNTIIPGRVTSEQMVTRLYPDPGERARFAADHIPVGHFGEPSDVAALTAFLADPAAGYLTGAVIPVDGGMRRHAF